MHPSLMYALVQSTKYRYARNSICASRTSRLQYYMRITAWDFLVGKGEFPPGDGVAKRRAVVSIIVILMLHRTPASQSQRFDFHQRPNPARRRLSLGPESLTPHLPGVTRHFVAAGAGTW